MYDNIEEAHTISKAKIFSEKAMSLMKWCIVTLLLFVSLLATGLPLGAQDEWPKRCELIDSSATAGMDTIEAIRAIEWNPTGTLYAVGGGPHICDSGNIGAYDILIIDAATHTVIQTLSGSECPITSLAWNSDGSKIAASNVDARIIVWDISGTKLGEVSTGPMVSRADSVGWSPVDASSVFAADASGRGMVFNQIPPTQVQFIGTLDADISVVRWTSPIDDAVTGHESGLVQRWDIDANTAVSTLAQHSSPVVDIGISSANNIVASASASSVIINDAATGAQLSTINISPIYDISISSDGEKLAIGTEGSLEIYDIATQLIVDSIAYDGGVLASSWSPHTDTVIFGGYASDFSNALMQIYTCYLQPG